MNGRLENELKTYSKVEKTLDMLPKFVSDWYYYLKANESTSSTCNDYINRVRRFLLFINKKVWLIQPSDITDEIVIRYFANIKTKTIIKNKEEIISNTSDSYRQGIWSCLNNLFEYLLSRDEIPYNYITKLNIKRPKHKITEGTNKKKFLTEDDFRAILSAVENGAGSKKAKSFQKHFKTRDLCIMSLFMITGMRESALAAINIDDVDFNNKVLTVIDKGNVTHVYPLPDQTISIIEDWLIDRTLILCGKDYNALFISRDCGRISAKGITKLVLKYSEEGLGYSISPHKLRAGFLSIIQNKYNDIYFTMKVAGHKRVTTTQIYVTTDNSEREKASTTMVDLLY